MGDDDIKIYEEPDFEGGSKDDFGIKQIALRLYQKALSEGAKEMSNSGGVVKRFVDGTVAEYPSINQREIYINTVQQLYTCLIPKIRRIKETDPQKLEYKEIEKVTRENDNTYSEQLKELRSMYDIKLRANKDEIRNRAINSYNHILKQIEDDYEVNKVNINRRLLIALSITLDDINYFEMREYID